MSCTIYFLYKQVVTNSYNVSRLPEVLSDMGMMAYDTPDDVSTLYPVMLDGNLIGWIERDGARDFVDSRRVLKVKGLRGVRVVHFVQVKYMYRVCAKVFCV